MNQENKKNKTPAVFLIILFLVIIGMAIYLAYPDLFHSPTTQNQSTMNSGIPEPKTLDMAPQLSQSEKTEVTVMQTDSTYIKYLVPTSNVKSFINALPQGDIVKSQNKM